MIFLLISVQLPASAAEQVYSFTEPGREKLFYEILEEVRCPDCPHQSLLETNSEIAKAIKESIYLGVVEGRSRREIVGQLEENYQTALEFNPDERSGWLWSLPIVLFVLLIGLLAHQRVSIGRSRRPPQGL